ncbi:MAG TPA: hypothetical protein PKX76_07330, partial [Flexilinea sp.]|nr:hypothetical protein [Flexilinea sp.]
KLKPHLGLIRSAEPDGVYGFSYVCVLRESIRFRSFQPVPLSQIRKYSRIQISSMLAVRKHPVLLLNCNQRNLLGDSYFRNVLSLLTGGFCGFFSGSWFLFTMSFSE